MSETKKRCNICGKMFDAKNLDQHGRDAHGQKKEYIKRSKFKFSQLIIIGGIIAAVAVGLAYWASIPHPSLAIEGVRCQAEMTTFHVHAHLDIFIDGEPFKIPAGTGIIPDRCLYWLHTHDDTGVIHIEAPVHGTFTLGQFFSIWGKTFNDNQIFDNVVSGNSTLSVYVNGEKVSGDYRAITLNAHDEIAIVYGAPPASIPSSYNFPQGL